MKSSGTIQIEFQQVIRQTDKLEKCADDLRKAQRELRDLMDDLKGGWAGDSANAYLQKCDELAGKLNKSATNLDVTAKVIEKSARLYRDAELAAIRLTQD